jgi:hypothetical protein
VKQNWNVWDEKKANYPQFNVYYSVSADETFQALKQRAVQ